MSLTSIMLRAAFTRSDNKRDAGLTTPENIERYDDIQYGPDARWNVLDVYRPKDIDERIPVIVSVHGGGWVYGDKERYQYYCMSLARQGFAVVNFSYRLAPRHKFPAALEDTNRVFRWLLGHAEQYGYDRSRVFAVGDSAGAQLLGLYCCLCADPGYAAGYDFSPPEGFMPRGVALNCGIYELQMEKKTDMDTRLMADLLPGKGRGDELRQISVLAHVNAAFPPAFVMTCEGDFLAEQARPLVEKLQTLGVPVTYRYYGDAAHVLGHVFHCNIRSADAARCNREECDFFRGL